MTVRKLLLVLIFLPILAHSNNAPYDWEYICNDNDFIDQYYNKKSYSDPVFLEELKNKRASPDCSAKPEETPAWAPFSTKSEEIAALAPFSVKKIEEVKNNFKEGLNVYEKWHFSPPNRRAVGILPGETKQKNFLFTQDTGYFSVFMCSPAFPLATSAFPLRMGKGTVELPEHTLFMAAVHELAHLQQDNSRHYIKEGLCTNTDEWYGEGIAEHLGTQATNDKFNTDFHGPLSNKYFRRFFMMRPYNVPLNLQPRPEGYPTIQALLGYRTNGFWDFVSRNYLKNDYSYYEKWDLGLSSAALKNQTGAMHNFLNNIDGDSNGLKHIFPQFLAEYATWPKHRFKNHLKGSDDLWTAISFGGCHKISLTPDKPIVKLDVSLDHYAGSCLDISIDGLTTGGEELSVHFEASDRNKIAPEIIDQLYLAVAEVTDTNQNFSCYETLKNIMDAKLGPCLLDPLQGKNSTLVGRYWSTDAFKANGGVPKLRMMLSRVPQEIKDVGTDRGTKTIPLSIGLSRATLTVNGQKKNSTATHQQVSGIMNSESGLHGNLRMKGGGGSLSNPLSTIPGLPANMPDLFKGRLKLPEVPLDIQGIAMFLVSEITPEDSNRVKTQPLSGTITFKNTISIGKTGDFTGAGGVTLANGGIAIDMVKGGSSKLTLTRNDATMLQYNGVINACVINPMMQQGCTQKITIKFEGSIAFGGLMIGDNQLTEWITPDYESYRNLRIARIQNMFQNKVPNSPTGTQSPPGSNSIENTSQPGMGNAGNNCDCSCETLMAMKKDRSKVVPACVMTCLPQLMQCTQKKR